MALFPQFWRQETTQRPRSWHHAQMERVENDPAPDSRAGFDPEPVIDGFSKTLLASQVSFSSLN